MNSIEKYGISFPVPSIDAPDRSTENVPDIMKGYGAYLEQQTGGKIHGRFRGVRVAGAHVIRSITKEEVKGNHFSPADTVGHLQRKAAGQIGTMIADQGLRDANSLYGTEGEFFCLQIYNSSYQFNMLKLELSPAYPISIWPDSGILEGNNPTQFRLNSKISTDEEGDYIIRVISDQDLVDTLGILFSSKKVQYILYRLIKMESEAEDRQNEKTSRTE